MRRILLVILITGVANREPIAGAQEATYRKMKQNLWWAAGYNRIAVPLAGGVLAPVGFVMPMSVGALLMSLSTVVVALNAQLLRRLDLRPETAVRNVLGEAASTNVPVDDVRIVHR